MAEPTTTTQCGSLIPFAEGVSLHVRRFKGEPPTKAWPSNLNRVGFVALFARLITVPHRPDALMRSISSLETSATASRSAVAYRLPRLQTMRSPGYNL